MNQKKFNKIFVFIVGALFLAATIVLFFIAPEMLAINYQIDGNSAVGAGKNLGESAPVIKHIGTPKPVKAVYMTACVASTPTFREDLVSLIEETEINSIVIDIKDFSGTISFESNNPDLVGVSATGCRATDMFSFIELLHSKNIYVIGRITVFQDPFFAKRRPDLAVQKASDRSLWKDYKGISFIDVSAEEYWDYILTIAKEAHDQGFDELNFDYIRFPSDGNMKDVFFPFSNDLLVREPVLGKQLALENFFRYLSEEISKYNKGKDFPMITSADLFGMVTTNTDDLNIGQVLERTLPYFDFVAPMVYPSHYPARFNGWTDPNKYPYELINFVMSSAVDRVAVFDTATSTPELVRQHVSAEQLRPWIQDFDYGGNYDVVEVKAQIQAVYDVGLGSWMLWSPSNRYTRGAIEDDQPAADKQSGT
ncbi:MAG TPA: putative glycoside hydrolase [Candidatus Paceibacterota bacterium]|nr:putative glycoside hydrolase [Candidatus Paceibacterota bacterium]HRZ34707.1 putative glycoside hydrolase [Candidatus Paceibacterota bacterium]